MTALLVRVTAAGVTPLDHTILSGNFPLANAPLVLGNEVRGWSRKAVTMRYRMARGSCSPAPMACSRNGSFGEWVAVRREHLCVIPANVDDVQAAGVPVAYLTAQIALHAAGMCAGKSVLAPAIGGSVGNAVTQLARALGAKHAVSTTTSTVKAANAKALGFDEVIDLSREALADGVRRITDGYGADIVIDAVGGEILSEALGILAPGGSLTTLGYAAGRKTMIDVTDLIWKRASIRSFLLFSEPPSVWAEAWKTVTALLASGSIRPIVARTFALEDAAEAIRYLVEDRPFGRVILTI